MKVLFACIPFDGHFLPLTGIAEHMKDSGHDVRFYTGASFGERLAKLNIQLFPFKRAVEVTAQNIEEHYPEIAKMKARQRAVKDGEILMFANIENHYRDVLDVYDEFPFDVLVADAAFYASYPISRKVDVPAFGIGPAPTPTAKSATGAPPPFFGFAPAKNVVDKAKYKAVWALVESGSKKSHQRWDALLEKEGIPAYQKSFFQLPWDAFDVMFQTGDASMDFHGVSWPANHVFVGPLLPRQTGEKREDLPFAEKLRNARAVVVVSQGTVDNRNPDKLFKPTLTAFAGTDVAVVVTTGGRFTEELRAEFPHDNVIIEDWIDFHQLLSHADVLINCGGYGSVMHALLHNVPLVVAGELEGKNDINVRLASRGLALNLKTEKPTADQIKSAVETVLRDPSYRTNVHRVSQRLQKARPFVLITKTIEDRVASESGGSKD